MPKIFMTSALVTNFQPGIISRNIMLTDPYSIRLLTDILEKEEYPVAPDNETPWEIFYVTRQGYHIKTGENIIAVYEQATILSI